MMKIAVLGLIAACIGSTAFGQSNNKSLNSTQSKEKFFIYDGGKYQEEDLIAAVRSPVQIIAPGISAGGVYSAPRAYDGHFYLPGSINGFPVIFMVDTGASMTALPASIAKNSGIRAGVSRDVVGSTGKSSGGLSENNKLTVGRFSLNGVKVLVSTNLTTPLLGADVLARFQIRQTAESIELSPRAEKISEKQADKKEGGNGDVLKVQSGIGGLGARVGE